MYYSSYDIPIFLLLERFWNSATNANKRYDESENYCEKNSPKLKSYIPEKWLCRVLVNQVQYKKEFSVLKNSLKSKVFFKKPYKWK